MGGDVFAGVDFGALGFVVAEGFDHHLLVGEGGVPVELVADVGGVEDEVFGDHAVVVGAERRDLELVGELHGRDGGGLGELGDAGAGSGGVDDGLVDLAEGDDVVGADVEEVGVVVVEALDAGGGEVLGVDELVAVAAVADDPDLFVVLDELEEDGEQAEAAAVDDGGAADDDDVEILLVLFEDLFGGKFGAAVELDGVGGLVFVDVVAEVARPRGSWWR